MYIEMVCVPGRRRCGHDLELASHEPSYELLSALQVKEGQGKFVQLPEAAYGDKNDFHKGLEV